MPRPDQWLRADVHDRLCSAAESLPDGFGLAVLDAWRPLELQHELYAAAVADPQVPPELIAAPSTDPATPPSAPHRRCRRRHPDRSPADRWRSEPGSTISRLCAHIGGIEATPGVARELRRLLYWTMQRHGFVVFDAEWWHFEFGTRRWAAITGGVARYGPTTPP